MEGASITHGVHPEGLRGILREHFATKWETVFGAEDVEDWLKHLGLAVAKQDIHDEAKKIAEYMVEVKDTTREKTLRREKKRTLKKRGQTGRLR